MSKKIVRVTEWAIAKHITGSEVLVGRLAENHHRVNVERGSLIEGHRIVSSTIVNKCMIVDAKSNIVETQNTIYHLIGEERQETIDDLRKEKGFVIERI